MKFNPIIKERVWGGDSLVKLFNKDYGAGKAVGESWELSSVKDDISVVTNGFLSGNSITEILETYMGEISGDKIYEKFSNEFPILVKLLDINDKLSIQVHPHDKEAIERHGSYGKAEGWFVMESHPESVVYLGFKRDVTRDEFLEALKEQRLESLLNVIHPEKGDFIYIPPGTLHAAYGGIVVTEIQQVSDITYRVYDWGRENNKESAREMHIDLALDVINYKQTVLNENIYKKAIKGSVSDTFQLINCEYFRISKIELSGIVRKDTLPKGQYYIFVGITGDAVIYYKDGAEILESGETILIPASMGEFRIESLTQGTTILEVTES